MSDSYCFFIDDDVDDLRMKITFVSQPPLEGSMWWINLAFSPVSPRQARTLITSCCIAFLKLYNGAMACLLWQDCGTF